MSALTHFGTRVVESPALPIPASPADQAVRIVRTGMADVLRFDRWVITEGSETGNNGRPARSYTLTDRTAA